MRTEYNFTEAQKAELKKIDDEIEQLNRRIFDLGMMKADIYALANCRYVFDTEEDVRTIEYAIAKGILNEPIIKKEGIVKMIFDERDEDER